MTHFDSGGIDRAAPWVYEAAAPDWVDELARELPDHRRLRGIELDPDDQYYPSEDDFDDEPPAADDWYTPHSAPLRYPEGEIRAVPTDDAAGSRRGRSGDRLPSWTNGAAFPARGDEAARDLRAELPDRRSRHDRSPAATGVDATGRAPATGHAAVPRVPDPRPLTSGPIDSGSPDSGGVNSRVPDPVWDPADELASRRQRRALPDPAAFDPGDNPWRLDLDAPAGAPGRPETDVGRVDARPTAWSDGREQSGSDRYTERPVTGRVPAGPRPQQHPGPVSPYRETGRIYGPDDRRPGGTPPAPRQAAGNEPWTANVPAKPLRDPSGVGLDDRNGAAPGGSDSWTAPHRAGATSARPQAPQPAPPAIGRAPRVVSTTTPVPLPRVLNRSAPPVAPRVISRSAPPPAPRVISTSTPPVTPRAVMPAGAPPPVAIVMPAAPPTAPRPATSPATEPMPPGSPGTRLATPDPASAGPATGPATAGPASTEGATDGGGRVIPLRRRPPPTEQADHAVDSVPRPTPGRPVDIPPAAGTTTGTMTGSNSTAAPGPGLVAPAVGTASVPAAPPRPGVAGVAMTAPAATTVTGTGTLPGFTTANDTAQTVRDALWDVIAPENLLPSALTPGPEPAEHRPATEPEPEPAAPATTVAGEAAEPTAEEAIVAVRWRLDSATLREVVDDRESLRTLGARLDQPLAESTDHSTKARLLCLRAEVFRLLDELGMAGAASQLALTHAEAAGDPAAVVIAQAELAHVLRLRGDVAEADRLFEQAASSADVPDVLRGLVHENAGRCCFDQGRYMEALDHFARAVRLGDPADLDLIERVDVYLEAVYIRVLRDGWGPYPRLRQEILPVSAPAAPPGPEPDPELFDPLERSPDDGTRAQNGVAPQPMVPQQVQRVANSTPGVSPGPFLRAADPQASPGRYR